MKEFYCSTHTCMYMVIMLSCTIVAAFCTILAITTHTCYCHMMTHMYCILRTCTCMCTHSLVFRTRIYIIYNTVEEKEHDLVKSLNLHIHEHEHACAFYMYKRCTILSRSCPMMPASKWAVRFSSSIHKIRSISVMSSDMIGRRSSGGHSRAPDTFVPPTCTCM